MVIRRLSSVSTGHFVIQQNKRPLHVVPEGVLNSYALPYYTKPDPVLLVPCVPYFGLLSFLSSETLIRRISSSETLLTKHDTNHKSKVYSLKKKKQTVIMERGWKEVGKRLERGLSDSLVNLASYYVIHS